MAGDGPWVGPREGVRSPGRAWKRAASCGGGSDSFLRPWPLALSSLALPRPGGLPQLRGDAGSLHCGATRSPRGLGKGCPLEGGGKDSSGTLSIIFS